MDLNISVVCTVYNDQTEILDLLNDVVKQSMKPSELVIADGGSKDHTVQLINDFARTSPVPVHLITGKRLNISQGFNTAIKNANASVIVVMGTGNAYESNFLEALAETYIRTNADVVYAPIRGKETTSFALKYNRAFLNGSYGSRIPSNHGVMIRREVFEKIGLFYEHFVYAGEDAEFFDRVQKMKLKVACAENAYVYWDVPRNIEQFKKQIKHYTIAQMQINSNAWILKKHRKNLCVVGAILLSLGLTLLGKCIIGAGLLCLVICSYMLTILRKPSDQLLVQYRRWLELGVTVSNWKIMKSEFKVDPQRIRYLEETTEK